MSRCFLVTLPSVGNVVERCSFMENSQGKYSKSTFYRVLLKARAPSLNIDGSAQFLIHYHNRAKCKQLLYITSIYTRLGKEEKNHSNDAELLSCNVFGF